VVPNPSNLIRVIPAEGGTSAMSLHVPFEVAASVSAKIVAARPLVHNITNFVVMNFTANALLAVGASPAMVHAEEEVEEFVALAQALVVNIGTLDAPFIRSMELAAAKAQSSNIPWVLDPVGVGATSLRNCTAARLADLGPSVIRGNAGEIIALAGLSGAQVRGVDSLAASDDAIAAAHMLSQRSGAVVAVTGATDYVVAPSGVTAIPGGHVMSQMVTGTGCATSAIVGACLAVAAPDHAAIAALQMMKLAAERAAARADAPGSFAVALIDGLHAVAHAR
jgi:hydroxyethylthiazole kinase